MGKMKELFMEQYSGSHNSGDEDYGYTEFLLEKEKEEKEFWDQFNNDGWTEEMEARYWAAMDGEIVESEASGSIFPADLFYDDEYYKSTYHPTKEEEEEAFKLFNQNNKDEHTNGDK